MANSGNKRADITERLRIEKELFEMYDKNNPVQLKKLQQAILVLHKNIPEIVIRRRFPQAFYNKALFDDLYQCGMMGMMSAVEKYNYQHDSKSSFYNYASFWVRKFIYDGKEQERIIRLPQWVALEVNKEYKKSQEFESNSFKTISEMILEAGTKNNSHEEQTLAWKKERRTTVKFEAVPLWGSSIKNSEDEEFGINLEAEMIGTGDFEEPSPYVERRGEFLDFLKPYMERPNNARNFEVFIDYHVGRMKMRQIAEKHGIHHAQVSNIINGKNNKNGTKTRPFIQRLQDYVKKELTKRGLDIDSMNYEEFHSMLLRVKTFDKRGVIPNESEKE